MRARILIADDQPDNSEALRRLLKGEGFETTAVASHNAIRRAVEKCDFELSRISLNHTRYITSGKGLHPLGALALDKTSP